LFITLEGPEGSGKSTQAPRLVAYLRSQGHDVLDLREPGGTSISDAVRRILLDFGSSNIDARTELLLYCASRAQLVAERIRPHLSHGGLVVCDRYTDSTLAYQGYGRGLDLEQIRAILKYATDGLTPDLTLLLDIDIDAGLRRKSGLDEWNRLDAESVEFHRRVRTGYLELVTANPQRWIVIDASQSREAVTADLVSAVSNVLSTR
jgi:dTMP kinase